MSIATSITRDHAIIILAISSVVSLISGLIITRINNKKDQENHSFYLKQEFYINFLVHQLMLNADRAKVSTVENSETYQQEMRLLNAEMLVKADIKLIREVIKVKHISNACTDRELMIPHVVNLVNKFRSQLHNKPITLQEFKAFIDVIKSEKEQK